MGVLFFIGFWMPKQKSKVQTTLKKLIVFNGFANEEYIYILYIIYIVVYIYIIYIYYNI